MSFNNCKPKNPCERPMHCDMNSSQIRYDGEDLPEAGVYHGAPLNDVISNLATYVSRAISLSGSVRKENFQGLSSVRLKYDPEEILQVSYCGAVLPHDAYRNVGRKLQFCRDYCYPDETASVQVIYREKFNASYGIRC